MIQEISLRWWPWNKGKGQNHKKQDDIDETLDRIAELRTKVDSELEDLKAVVNSENLWFKCYQVTEDHQGGDPKP